MLKDRQHDSLEVGSHLAVVVFVDSVRRLISEGKLWALSLNLKGK